MLYFIFGLQFIICTCFFIRTWAQMKNISLYQDLQSRITKILYVLPPIACILICILFACFTRYFYTTVLLSAIILPFISIHILNEPLVLKRVSTPEHLGNSSYRRVEVLGIRSRILTIGAIANLLLMSYALING